MSYYSNFKGHKPLVYESNDDDVPMISRERYAPPRCYQDNWSQPYQSRSWNEESLVNQEIEQPEMSSLERLLKEAIEQTERQNRELDEIFDWNFEPNHERPYDTFTNANEHVDDVEAIEYNDYYSNVDIAESSNFVFQDDSESETDEEEEKDEFTNYPHGTSQVVLQDLHTLEPELTEDSDLEDPDEEDSDEEDELDIEEEKLVEEVVEISVMPTFEVSSLPTEFSTVDEELKKEVKSVTKKLEEAPIAIQNDKCAEILENQILPRFDYPNLDEELYALLGLDDGELHEQNFNEDEMMTEEEVLESMELKVDESHPLVEEVERLRDDDMLCLKTSPEASLTDLKPKNLPCEHDFVLIKEPKPPDSFIAAFKDLSLPKEDELKIDMDRGIWSRLAPNMGITTHIGSDFYGLLDDPGGIEISISFSLVMASSGFSQSYWGIILSIDKPLENKWRLDVHVTIFIGEIIYKNNITIDNILQTEYDWKGSSIVMADPP